MTNPYENLPSSAFWKLAVAQKSMFDIEGIWNPKFRIEPDQKVVTFGSCFAQHIGRALNDRGFSWISTENAPAALSKANATRFNYDVFSSRTGNIYTTSLLHQWTQWALGKTGCPEEVWEQDGRFYDPFRPVIEPNGFSSAEEMKLSRDVAIGAFKKCIETADYFVFTLGLTESWKNKAGYEYPMCPGTAAGAFNAAEHIYENQDYISIINGLHASIKLMLELNNNIKFILTVSPVPLTATCSGNHVVVATMESKSILRAVAGQAAKSLDNVDYFPSYELINSPTSKGIFFEPNQRSVNHYGVDFVMDQFFTCLAQKYGGLPTKSLSPNIAEINEKKSDADVVCEEELLNAFGGGK
ncbi:GSCFA domain-containing protein [Methylovulum miyakonense]|uniref:GSCFA domain-containing protein n=1 Tax=Methylovulum miyakonense TaxID=645578 RepID=UPI00037D08B8|nr:GSCFA domain-containing protein [Methylovulum miyakonense]